MLVSTKGRYALRLMTDLAERNSDEYVAIKAVAERQEISLKYIERIMPSLVSAGLVEGIHGKGGGYKLTRKPEEYTIGEILRAAEGSVAPISCLECGAAPCPRKDQCRTIGMWTELSDVINDFLDGKTLKDLVKKSST